MVEELQTPLVGSYHDRCDRLEYRLDLVIEKLDRKMFANSMKFYG